MKSGELARSRACFQERENYQWFMPSAIASKTVRSRDHRTAGRKLASAEIRGRLEQIELATVSALRALQMDIDGDEGVPSATVIKRARAALR